MQTSIRTPGNRFFLWYTISILVCNIFFVIRLVYDIRNGHYAGHAGGFALLGIVVYGLPILNAMFIPFGLVKAIAIRLKHRDSKLVRHILLSVFLPVVGWLLFLAIILMIRYFAV